jgi:signal transduction histidine kinase
MALPWIVETTTPVSAADLGKRRRQRWFFFFTVCMSIAVFISVLGRGHLGTNMVYSFSIGGCCWGLTELLRWCMAQLIKRWRLARGIVSTRPDTVGWLSTLPLLALAGLAGSPLGLWIADELTGQQSPSIMNWQSPGTRFTLGITLVASVVVVFGISLMERLADARASAEAARRQATEMQLKLLEAQLEPHMLFNTLANLRVLIGIEPARAQAMLDRLITFLRATLAASRTGSHSLATEFDRVADYLALMAMRMGPRLAVQLELPDALRELAVPPLLLQPLVENSIRHGLEPKVAAGRITVSAAREGNTLLLSVLDTGVGLASTATPAKDGSGFGLEQVRARLATLYGDAASLSLQPGADADGGTLALIRLPLP